MKMSLAILRPALISSVVFKYAIILPRRITLTSLRLPRSLKYYRFFPDTNNVPSLSKGRVAATSIVNAPFKYLIDISLEEVSF